MGTTAVADHHDVAPTRALGRAARQRGRGERAERHDEAEAGRLVVGDRMALDRAPALFVSQIVCASVIRYRS
jgi:hypothetical protein